jgi:hypothetical protein
MGGARPLLLVHRHGGDRPARCLVDVESGLAVAPRRALEKLGCAATDAADGVAEKG